MTSKGVQSSRRISRVLALQSRMSVECFAEGVLATEDPSVLNAMTNLIRVWAWKNPLVPADFFEKVSVCGVARQPVLFASVDLECCDRKSEQLEAPLPPDRKIDARAWPTDNLFRLVAIAPQPSLERQ